MIKTVQYFRIRYSGFHVENSPGHDNMGLSTKLLASHSVMWANKGLGYVLYLRLRRVSSP